MTIDSIGTEEPHRNIDVKWKLKSGRTVHDSQASASRLIMELVCVNENSNNAIFERNSRHAQYVVYAVIDCSRLQIHK